MMLKKAGGPWQWLGSGCGVGGVQGLSGGVPEVIISVMKLTDSASNLRTLKPLKPLKPWQPDSPRPPALGSLAAAPRLAAAAALNLLLLLVRLAVYPWSAVLSLRCADDPASLERVCALCACAPLIRCCCCCCCCCCCAYPPDVTCTATVDSLCSNYRLTSMVMAPITKWRRTRSGGTAGPARA